MRQSGGQQTPLDEQPNPNSERPAKPSSLLWRLWLLFRRRPRLFQRTDAKPPARAARKKKSTAQTRPRLSWLAVRLLPIWLLLGLMLVLAPGLPLQLANGAVRVIRGLFTPEPIVIIVPSDDPVQEALSQISPVFTQEVAFWGDDIARWSVTYEIPPNFIATIMQIESCGHPNVVSSAGATGLFQVMPFHFEPGEVHTDPNTNADAGMTFMASLLELANDDVAGALAGYNAGQGAIDTPFESLPSETQRYVYWGTGIYTEALSGASESARLTEWLDAGGHVLCSQAAARLGLTVTPRPVQSGPESGG